MVAVGTLRGSVAGRLLLALSGIGGGFVLGVLFALIAVLGHWSDPWGVPPHEVARRIVLPCVAAGASLGAIMGVVLAGNPMYVGFLGGVPTIVIMANLELGWDMGLPRQTSFLVIVPALAVVLACLLSLAPVRRRRPHGEEGAWMWRALWARVLGKPLPPLPESLRPRLDRTRECPASAEVPE